MESSQDKKEKIRRLFIKYGLDAPTIFFLIAILWSIGSAIWVEAHAESIYITRISRTVINGDTKNETTTYDVVTWAQWACDTGDLFYNLSPQEAERLESWHLRTCTGIRTSFAFMPVIPLLATLILYKVGRYRWMMFFAFISVVIPVGANFTIGSYYSTPSYIAAMAIIMMFPSKRKPKTEEKPQSEQDSK